VRQGTPRWLSEDAEKHAKVAEPKGNGRREAPRPAARTPSQGLPQPARAAQGPPAGPRRSSALAALGLRQRGGEQECGGSPWSWSYQADTS
jgi:hypothetical protein